MTLSRPALYAFLDDFLDFFDFLEDFLFFGPDNFCLVALTLAFATAVVHLAFVELYFFSAAFHSLSALFMLLLQAVLTLLKRCLADNLRRFLGAS